MHVVNQLGQARVVQLVQHLAELGIAGKAGARSVLAERRQQGVAVLAAYFAVGVAVATIQSWLQHLSSPFKVPT